jgi:short-subunit dehydrogenase
MNIIVTGTSRGIGYELVKHLSKSKHNQILAISRNGAKLKQLAAECLKQNPDAKVTPYEFDLQQFDFYPLIAQRIEALIHRCDILINNAGKVVNKPFLKTEPADFDDIFNTNFKSLYFFTQAVVPLMNKGGHIVNIGSMGGVSGSKKFHGLTAYSASKGAVAILTETLAGELADLEIHVNCLALGSVQTEMFGEAFPGSSASVSPANMAQFIADFALHSHKFFNGKVLPVAITTP